MRQLLSRLKAVLILLNFALSFIGLCVDTSHSPIWVSMVGLLWFAGSCTLLIRADKKGTMDNLKQRTGFDEL